MGFLQSIVRDAAPRARAELRSSLPAETAHDQQGTAAPTIQAQVNGPTPIPGDEHTTSMAKPRPQTPNIAEEGRSIQGPERPKTEPGKDAGKPKTPEAAANQAPVRPKTKTDQPEPGNAKPLRTETVSIQEIKLSEQTIPTSPGQAKTQPQTPPSSPHEPRPQRLHIVDRNEIRHHHSQTIQERHKETHVHTKTVEKTETKQDSAQPGAAVQPKKAKPKTKEPLGKQEPKKAEPVEAKTKVTAKGKAAQVNLPRPQNPKKQPEAAPPRVHIGEVNIRVTAPVQAAQAAVRPPLNTAQRLYLDAE